MPAEVGHTQSLRREIKIRLPARGLTLGDALFVDNQLPDAVIPRALLVAHAESERTGARVASARERPADIDKPKPQSVFDFAFQTTRMFEPPTQRIIDRLIPTFE